MKVRNDFVTNSSSSSFVLAFRNKEDGVSTISKLKDLFGESYVNKLLTDFMEQDPIPLENLSKEIDIDLYGDAYSYLCFRDRYWWTSGEKPFKDRWMEKHPGAKYADFVQSVEFNEAMEETKNKFLSEIIKEIGDRKYVVTLEYSDETSTGGTIEHEILPECDFTVRRFSNH